MIFVIWTEDITKPALSIPITSFLSAKGTYSDYRSNFKIMDDQYCLTIENIVHKKSKLEELKVNAIMELIWLFESLK